MQKLGYFHKTDYFHRKNKGNYSQKDSSDMLVLNCHKIIHCILFHSFVLNFFKKMCFHWLQWANFIENAADFLEKLLQQPIAIFVDVW